jgi:hypothetical protein
MRTGMRSISVLILSTALISSGCKPTSDGQSLRPLDRIAQEARAEIANMQFPDDISSISKILEKCKELPRDWHFDACMSDSGSASFLAVLYNSKRSLTVAEMKQLFDAGCMKALYSPDGSNHYLGYAISRNHSLEVIKYLIEQGNRPEKILSEHGPGTALNVALLSKRSDVAIYFIDKYPQFATKPDPVTKRTPLESAQQAGMGDVVTVLNKVGANR